MQVITKFPVTRMAGGGLVVNTILDGYSGIDASSSYQDILDFQTWANRFKGTSLAIDGIYGPKSKAAYAKYGAEFERAKADPTYVPKKVSAPVKKVVASTNSSTSTNSKTEPKAEEESKPSSTSSGTVKSKFSDKAKIALAISAVVLAVVGIRIIQKMVKK